MLKAEGVVTGHQVAERVAQNYGHLFDINPARLWRSVEAVAEEELTAISREPESLTGALWGLDDNVR